MNSAIACLTPTATIALMAGGADMTGFGPGTERCWLPLDLRGAGIGAEGAALGAWLATLPCPVVAIADSGSDRALLAGCDAVVDAPARLAAIAETVQAAPIAAMTFVQVLRIVEKLPAEDALTAESFAYGVLQGGPEFARWRKASPPRDRPAPEAGAAVEIEREAGELRLTLNRPKNRNALSLEMRDALVEAFDLVALDDSIAAVTLQGAGKCFSLGGDLTEFGLAADPAQAHWVRSVRSPARAVMRTGPRLHAYVHGACVGAGVELAAFAGKVTAAPGSHFQLPELRMGLLPGAGGCVSLTRRIGRHRTALMGLSARRIDAATALAWGLVDEIA